MVEEMFKGAATAKGALIITPERVIVTTPEADNKKELYFLKCVSFSVLIFCIKFSILSQNILKYKTVLNSYQI